MQWQHYHILTVWQDKVLSSPESIIPLILNLLQLFINVSESNEIGQHYTRSAPAPAQHQTRGGKPPPNK